MTVMICMIATMVTGTTSSTWIMRRRTLSAPPRERPAAVRGAGEGRGGTTGESGAAAGGLGVATGGRGAGGAGAAATGEVP